MENENLSSKNNRHSWLLLALMSGLGLFVELAVIRWMSSEVRLFSYLKNIPLLAAFLGLSIGYAIVGKGRDYKKAFPALLLIYSALVLVVGRISSPRALAYPGGDEFVWYTADFSYWLSLATFLGMVFVFFLITMLLFIPLGQATGEEMARYKPVPAYVVNIAASLIGIWLFSVVSYFQWPPAIWFGIAILGVGVYYYARKLLNPLNGILLAVVLIGVAIFGQNAIWSPYQRLVVTDLILPREDTGEAVKVGYTINVQQVFYQRAIDLSPEFLASLEGQIPEMEDIAVSYNLPYLLADPGGQVLIVGAGSGNDAAAALRNQAGHVDAVEIDPAIIEMGYDLHPEHPYKDPRVTPITDDARAFFEETDKKYDVIAFGLLDSHTLLSSLSSVRLDSYVYTLESFRQVRAHLKENGITAVTFATSTPWIEERLGRMLAEVFGADKVWVHYGAVGATFVAGPVTTEKAGALSLESWSADPAFNGIPLPTDDWPYLYLRARKVPAAYWQALLLIAAAAIFIFRRSFPEALKPDWHFLLLGAAFMLIEFTSITRLALLFGTTWLVNALAISGVLLMILAANLFVLWRPRIDLRWTYALLFVSLGLVYFFPLEFFNRFDPLWRGLGSVLILSLPLFFSGLIFSESLRRRNEITGPLASNLSGSVFGGIIEYSSIWWGVQSLYLIGIAVYGLALAAFLRKKGE